MNNQGLVPETDVRCLGEFGDELDRRFSQPVAETSGSDNVELPLSKPMDIDHLIIMEDISQGERTREYVVNGLTPDGKWHRLCSGQSIGHKRIERFTPIKIAGVQMDVGGLRLDARREDLFEAFAVGGRRLGDGELEGGSAAGSGGRRGRDRHRRLILSGGGRGSCSGGRGCGGSRRGDGRRCGRRCDPGCCRGRGRRDGGCRRWRCFRERPRFLGRGRR